MSVIAAVDDLFFGVRIRETARHVGVTAEVVPSAQVEEAVQNRLERGGVEAVILDLGAASAVDRVRALKANPGTRQVPVIGFVSHVATEVIAAAREAGCDQVLARSAFTQQLGEILRRLALGAPAAAGQRIAPGDGAEGSPARRRPERA
ncbi:MAG TPA: response regulator [Terriglobia bacterium]|nr:response regulator [Terriglobia bacterium]